MGCCQAKETIPNHPKDLTRTSTIPKQYTQVNQSSLNKRFSAQIESIKSSESNLNSIFSQSATSSKHLIESLGKLDFHLSEKKFSEFEPPEDLSCPQCLLRFSTNEIPLILNCGHSLCKICCDQFFSEHESIPCVFNCIPTSAPPDILKVNNCALDQVKIINSGQYCYVHQTSAELFCSTCKKIICEECSAEHEKHKILVSNSEDLNQEFKIWENNLVSYQKKIEKNRENLLRYKKKYRDLEKSLTELCENHFSSLVQSKKEIFSVVSASIDDHIFHIKACVEKLDTNNLSKKIRLYSDVIQEELNRVKELLDNFEKIPVSVSLKEQAKIPLKFNGKITEPDFRPWEGLSKSLEDMRDFEYFLLALAALKLSKS